MYIFITILLLVFISVFIILRLPVFGALPSKNSQQRIKRLPNFKDGALQNLSATPMYPEGVTIFTILKQFIKKSPTRTPHKVLPFVPPDFEKTSNTTVTWFGHSSYLLQANGHTILVDPIFSATPSPFSFLGSRNYPGTDFVKPEDLPELDIILITHDHYDHLDYRTIKALKNKTKYFITSVGVSAHLEKWGIDASKITELEWGESTSPLPDIKFIATAARHFSGRKFKRNQSLWSGFVLQTSNHTLYLGGDSGYDIHFKEIGEQYGPFDLAILECGQYNAYWPYIHMFPEQVVQAAKDLRASVVLPVHWGKFTLALHDWNDPIVRVVKKANEENMQITTPMLGEKLIIGEYYPDKQWWND